MSPLGYLGRREGKIRGRDPRRERVWGAVVL